MEKTFLTKPKSLILLFIQMLPNLGMERDLARAQSCLLYVIVYQTHPYRTQSTVVH